MSAATRKQIGIQLGLTRTLHQTVGIRIARSLVGRLSYTDSFRIEDAMSTLSDRERQWFHDVPCGWHERVRYSPGAASWKEQRAEVLGTG
ncbi:hypothetical protein FU659_33800 [Paenibacillus sp. N3.4]|nr:hypothetical protein FU659_33800 [Paenibacillus sp. N3.4]